MDALGDLQLAKKKKSTTGVAKKSRVPKKNIFTHVDAHGRAAMVDVGEKAVTARRAVAEARVMISPELANRILGLTGSVPIDFVSKDATFSVGITGYSTNKDCITNANKSFLTYTTGISIPF